MARAALPDRAVPASTLAQPQHARLDLSMGAARLQADVTVSPAALLAIGGMVGMMLIGSAAIVWTARRAVARGRREA